MGRKLLRFCEKCSEPIVPYSRVCANCLYLDNYSDDFKCQLIPMPFLDIMRGYLDELVALPKCRGVVDPHSKTIRELFTSFDAVEGVTMISFGDKADVRQAVDMIYEMMSEEMERRRATLRRNRIIASSVVLSILLVIAAIILIFS
ncbi:MAG: hypothetical protein R3Y16_04245 [Rikenellaceae bacterium]